MVDAKSRSGGGSPEIEKDRGRRNSSRRIYELIRG